MFICLYVYMFICLYVYMFIYNVHYVIVYIMICNTSCVNNLYYNDLYRAISMTFQFKIWVHYY